MPLDNLDAPLRLTWDLCPKSGDHLSLNDLNRVAERLIDAGIFYLSLEEQPLLHQDLPDLLAELATGGCQISLIIG
ncbi:MAG: hypothetical protein L3J63_05600, partial [Geopsychrobacter sp.]|nr:hypothetical protein [Geopsychrobacter sp.]